MIRLFRFTVVARARWSYPEDRQLGDSITENTRKLDAIRGPNRAR